MADPTTQDSEIPKEEATPLFYNVLPRETMHGPLVGGGHTAAPTNPAPIPQGDATTHLEDVPATREPITLPHHNRKVPIIIGSVVILLLLAGGIYWYLTHRSTPTKPLVSNTPPPITGTKADDQQKNDSVQPDGVTTPTEWQKKYFNNEVCQKVADCGDVADPDKDGLTNLDEYKADTDPNNADSDGEGISDGDELNVFGSAPLITQSAKDQKFNDADYVKGGYDFTTGKKLSADQLTVIKQKVVQYSLHKPTTDTLTAEQLSRYGYPTAGSGGATADPLSGVDQSPQAVLSRDTSRLTTMQRVGAALLKYQKDKKAYPISGDFNEMVGLVKAYNTVATNYNDPVNKAQYVYGYASDDKGTDFTLTYYSETQHQAIKYTAADAKKDTTAEASQLNDDTRKNDLENIRSALLVYSAAKLDKNSTVLYVFPASNKYKTELVPQYLTALPKDPLSGKDYEYKVSDKFDSFTLKATLEKPEDGTTGYLCNQEECRNY